MKGIQKFCECAVQELSLYEYISNLAESGCLCITSIACAVRALPAYMCSEGVTSTACAVRELLAVLYVHRWEYSNCACSCMQCADVKVDAMQKLVL